MTNIMVYLMSTRKRFIPIILTVIIFFSLCISYTYSQLSPMKRRELMIAYMNGYYEAAQTDIEELKLLQEDKDSLKKKVKAQGEKYATLIDIMNPSKESREGRKYKVHKHSPAPLDVDRYKIKN